MVIELSSQHAMWNLLDANGEVSWGMKSGVARGSHMLSSMLLDM